MECFDGGSPKHNQLGGLLPFFKCAKNTVRYPFHKAFKDITADSPLQYLKKIRLAKARDLIVQRKMRANLAATEVGYESPSQFSREFKRYFGESPADVMREMRTA